MSMHPEFEKRYLHPEAKFTVTLPLGDEVKANLPKATADKSVELTVIFHLLSAEFNLHVGKILHQHLFSYGNEADLNQVLEFFKKYDRQLHPDVYTISDLYRLFALHGTDNQDHG